MVSLTTQWSWRRSQEGGWARVGLILAAVLLMISAPLSFFCPISYIKSITLLSLLQIHSGPLSLIAVSIRIKCSILH